MMFRGTYELSLDAKGRLAVPSRFRDDLRKLSGGSMVLTTSVGRDRFLLLYTLDEWEKLEARLSGLSDFNPAERAVKNVLLRNAEDLTLDGNGRFVIPQRHRGFAALEKEVSLQRGPRLEGGGGEEAPRRLRLVSGREPQVVLVLRDFPPRHSAASCLGQGIMRGGRHGPGPELFFKAGVRPGFLNGCRHCSYTGAPS